MSVSDGDGVAAYGGGCQCGAVRYRAEGPHDPATVCYCRMCQKAGAAPFMAFVRFHAERVQWTTPPALFASSSVVERGFCRDCGTPLSYRQVGGPFISLTIHSLDDPGSVQPEVSLFKASAALWCSTLAALPERAFALPPGIVSYQSGP